MSPAPTPAEETGTFSNPATPKAVPMVAKFKVTNVVKHHETLEELEFMAVTDKDFDPDGKSDDNSFSRWTPSGTLKMTVTNPELIGKFVAGQKFYLNFNPAD